MKIATIILNYNSANDCKKCIAGLQLQEGVEQEIVVVDNCSRKEEREAVKDICQTHGATFIANETNGGYNAGNNIGLRYAAEKGYKFALIANPDMEFPQKDYLTRLLAPMLADSEIVACGSDIVTPNGIHQNPMHRDGDWHDSLGWFIGLFKKKPTDTYDFIDNFTVNHLCAKLSGCCFAVSLAFINEIGFFDEYPMLYCEEAIFSRQVERKGKKMYYTADTQAIHAHIKDKKGNPVNRLRQWKRSRLYFIKKYSGDNALGRFLASLLTRIYIGMLIAKNRLF